MFDLQNIDKIQSMINLRDSNMFVIPLYVKMGNKTFGLLELDTIKSDYCATGIKVGFGTSSSMFMSNSFNGAYIYDFDFINRSVVFNEEDDTNIVYTVFESSYVEDTSIIHQQVNEYISLLTDYLSKLHTEFINSLSTTNDLSMQNSNDLE